MIHLRTMTQADIPFVMRLKATVGWNQTEADWRRLIAAAPEGCFIAELEGRPVGTASNCVFGQVGWTGMVLVDESVRRRGIGTRLMKHSLTYLDTNGARTARLDATPAGRPLYEKLGFQVEYGLVRMEGISPGGSRNPRVEPLKEADFESTFALDRCVKGTDRGWLLRRLHEEQPETAWVYRADGEIRGYAMSRPGTRAVLVGPALALEAEAGRALLETALAHHAGEAVYLDIPTDNAEAMWWAKSRRLSVQRGLARMRRGEPFTEKPEFLWCNAAPEKG